jgi:hypothetical protein
MPILKDARSNEFLGSLDQIGGGTVSDARVAVATLGALNAEQVMDLNGQAVAVFDLRSAALSATVVFEATVDGTNYFSLPAFDIVLEEYIASVVVSGTIAKTYVVGVSGFRRVRTRISAYTSGNVVSASRASIADFAIYGRPIPSTKWATITAAANTAATITLSAAGPGLFHYITGLYINRTATAALAGTATLVITTTNLPGSIAFSVGNAMVAGGTQRDVELEPSNPIKSSVANTATTIVMPAPGAAVLWRGNCSYYVGA